MHDSDGISSRRRVKKFPCCAAGEFPDKLFLFFFTVYLTGGTSTCSGFVTWSFINSGFNASSIGHGTKGQIAKCSRISWESVQAGDLAFYGDLSHVGIVAGKDAAGNILVIHCSSGGNNVVITTNSGFGFAARPRCY